VHNHRRRHHSKKILPVYTKHQCSAQKKFGCAVAVRNWFLHISFTPSKWLILCISLADMPMGIGPDGNPIYKVYMMPVVVVYVHLWITLPAVPPPNGCMTPLTTRSLRRTRTQMTWRFDMDNKKKRTKKADGVFFLFPFCATTVQQWKYRVVTKK